MHLHQHRYIYLAYWALGIILVTGCDQAGPFTQSDDGQIDVFPGDAIEFQKGELAVGETVSRTIQIRNKAPHASKLDVSVRFEYDSAALDEETRGLSLQLVGGDREAVLEPLDRGGEVMELEVEFRRYSDAQPRTGRLIIQSDTQQQTRREIVIEVKTAEGLPVANVSPKLLDLGEVALDTTKKKGISLSNTGSDPLTVGSILFQGHGDYRLTLEGSTWEPGEPIEFEPPLQLQPSEATTFEVSYTSHAAQPAEARVVFYTNDPAQPSGSPVEIVTNAEGGFIKANPKKLQYGAKLIGNKSLLPLHLENTGTKAVHITEVFLAEGAPDVFVIDTAKVPLTLPVNETVTFHVEFTPAMEATYDATLVIVSDALNGTIQVPVTGTGSLTESPTAIAVVQEGEQVIPQTTLHLFGDQSFAPSGPVQSWKWSVKQPPGSASVFVPSDTFTNPTFVANVAGEYEFALDVWDELSTKSLVPSKVTVLVVPDEAIHVELLWHTPNDPDETDSGPEAGSDLDLHFALVPLACTQPDIDLDGKADPWFDQPFDTFWFNAHPNWGSFDPSIDDDPGLDLDDTDGAGPENLNLNQPQAGEYRVGVHYWSDHGYGPAFATVRIYLYSNLVFEITDVKMLNRDMWCVATIEWPSGKITMCEGDDGEYDIFPNYLNPFFFQP